jgi:hypothetical protein
MSRASAENEVDVRDASATPEITTANENRMLITLTITGLDVEGQIVGDIESVLDDPFDSEAVVTQSRDGRRGTVEIPVAQNKVGNSVISAVMAIEEAGATVTAGEELVTA